MEAIYLLSHQWLLDGCEVLQRREQDVAIFWAPDVLHKATEFVTERRQHFIFIFHGLCTIVSVSPAPL